MNKQYGYSEGDVCGRKDCAGVIEYAPVENCSCHISPPCSACTAPRAFCPECDWREADEERINDYVVQVDRATGTYKSWEPRPLDSTKVDWHSFPHSSCSMRMAGVYPPGTTKEEVRKLVDGTFGGRFNKFANGEFEFIAYTD